MEGPQFLNRDTTTRRLRGHARRVEDAELIEVQADRWGNINNRHAVCHARCAVTGLIGKPRLKPEHPRVEFDGAIIGVSRCLKRAKNASDSDTSIYFTLRVGNLHFRPEDPCFGQE